MSEDDQVEIDGRRIASSGLVREHGPRIARDADLLDPVFVEK